MKMTNLRIKKLKKKDTTISTMTAAVVISPAYLISRLCTPSATTVAIAATPKKRPNSTYHLKRPGRNTKKEAPLGLGGIDYHAIRAAMTRAGYTGWVSIETNKRSDAEHAAFMDDFFRGNVPARGYLFRKQTSK